MVKANGYGHGAAMVAETALQSGASRLGVYTVEEGLILRQAGIQAPILVFGPFTSGEAVALCEARLTPTIATLAAAEALQQACGERGLPYHVKIDTGLSRAGILPSEAASFVAQLNRYPALRPEGIFTHFARADEADKGPTIEQLRAFLHTVQELEALGLSFPLKHAANSAAAIDVRDAHLDMVRLGISVYGYFPSLEVSRLIALRPAMRLVSAVSRVVRVPPGTGVGYGHEFSCNRPSRLALVPVGYGDGLPRQLGCGRGSVLIRGFRVPIVGRVSMDQLTVDVTDLPSVTVGDEAVLIGGQGSLQQTAEDLADVAGTISYDILTGFLPRVPRLYLRRGKLVGVQRQITGPQIVEGPGS